MSWIYSWAYKTVGLGPWSPLLSYWWRRPAKFTADVSGRQWLSVVRVSVGTGTWGT